MASQSNKRRQPRQSRSRVTVDAILDSVSHVLARGSTADDVTTTRIAEVAGVSVGTLYQYFGSKEEIFYALHDREHERTNEKLRAALTSSRPASVGELTAVLLDTLIATRADDPELYHLLLHKVPRRPNANAEAKKMTAMFIDVLERFEGEFYPGTDRVRFVFALGHMIQGLANGVALHRPDGLSFDEARDEAWVAIRAYLSVYGPPGPHRETSGPESISGPESPE